MKLYVLLTFLKREEWTRGTVWQVAKGLFELGLRGFLGGDKGDIIGAHLGLFFEDANDRMIACNASLDKRLRGERCFCIDVLRGEKHAVSVLHDRKSWYQKWDWAHIEFYEVLAVENADIERAHTQLL